MNRNGLRAILLLWLSACARAHPPTQRSAALSASGTVPDTTLVVKHSEESLFPDSTERTRHRIRILKDLVDRYVRVNGSLPSRLEPLVEPFKRDGVTLLDTWSRPLVYTRNGESYQIRSAGKDGRMNSDDDIVDSGHAGVTP